MTYDEAIDRLHAMVEPGQQSWDLSPNDVEVITEVLTTVLAMQCDLDQLRLALNFACTPPYPCNEAAIGRVDDTLVRFYLRRAADKACEYWDKREETER